MEKTDILYLDINQKVLQLNHNCKTENGIESDEIFIINKILGDFEQLEIINQYKQTAIINPNQLENEI